MPDTSKPCVFAVVLAAGEAKRFGATKQLVETGGEAMVRRCARLAREACGDRSLLILGHDCEAVRRAADEQCQFHAINEHFADGIGTSIACAARVCSQADALLILLADQVHITASHLRALLDAWSGDEDEIVASAYAGTLGPPVLLPRASFPELLRLSGDAGAKSILESGRFNVHSVDCAAAATDIDSVDDLSR